MTTSADTTGTDAWPGEIDIYLFNEGRHRRLWQLLGASQVGADPASGVRFTVWAPNAREVYVVGDWNHWGDGTLMVPIHAERYPRRSGAGGTAGSLLQVRGRRSSRANDLEGRPDGTTEPSARRRTRAL